MLKFIQINQYELDKEKKLVGGFVELLETRLVPEIGENDSLIDIEYDRFFAEGEIYSTVLATIEIDGNIDGVITNLMFLEFNENVNEKLDTILNNDLGGGEDSMLYEGDELLKIMYKSYLVNGKPTSSALFVINAIGE